MGIAGKITAGKQWAKLKNLKKKKKRGATNKWADLALCEREAEIREWKRNKENNGILVMFSHNGLVSLEGKEKIEMRFHSRLSNSSGT